MQLLIDDDGKSTEIDAHRLMSRLWQGSYPRSGAVLAELGFDVLVLCAYELQTPDTFPEVGVYMCPLDDARLSEVEAREATRAAQYLADLHRQGKRILVTCAQGRNRSRLVSALTIRLLTGCTGRHACNIVRVSRPTSLMNPSFKAYLDGLPAPTVASRAGFGRVHPVSASVRP